MDDVKEKGMSLTVYQSSQVGNSQLQVSVWLGHSTFSTTADIYSHLDFHAQIESGLVMDGMFERNPVAEPTGLAADN